MTAAHLPRTDPPHDADDPARLAWLRAVVSDRVLATLDDLSGELTAISPEAVALVDAVKPLARGGKRLRAAFCYWGWRGEGGQHGGDEHKWIVDVCVALELFQIAALVHDDIIDASDTRRGLPSVHRHFETAHTDAAALGSAADFGIAAALLVGDLLLVLTERVFGEATADLPPEIRAGARRVFDQMRAEVTAGQYLDILAETRPWPDDPTADIERARIVVRAKSASYSVERPTVLGAALAGGDRDRLRAWSGFALPVGEAFQLRDDLLGVFGDPAVTGKPAGDDLREGKRTVLLAYALGQADPHERGRLTTRVGDPGLDEDGVEELRSILQGTGAVQRVEDLIDSLLAEASDAKRRLDLDQEASDALSVLVAAATDRVH